MQNHREQEFYFTGKNGKPLKVVSKPFTFEVEDMLKDRFGQDVFEKVNSGSRFEFDVKPEHIKEDMPCLLTGFDKVDQKKTVYDQWLEVYHFFLTYKRNAWLRQLKQEMTTTALTLEKAEQLLALVQKNILAQNS
ncbi:MAG: hypothetical protein KKB34_10200 [Bacteroidetes bacterium]|nr:hypothetical protein [Bacteroidota bacterium]